MPELCQFQLQWCLEGNPDRWKQCLGHAGSLGPDHIEDAMLPSGPFAYHCIVPKWMMNDERWDHIYATEEKNL